ncbi:MAG: MBL fold metallo-hydrolase [Dehalococcoidia bacterium]|nr:MBL fold metallo-hydrolase [Dehalococcoidia bacterium]
MKIADDGVLQFTVPMPFALREVHVYALETSTGWVLIDSGFPSEAARAQLSAELQQAIGGLSRIALIILTHFHPDHSGLAGWMQQGSGCPVVIHEADWPLLQRMNTLDMAGEFFRPIAKGAGLSSGDLRELFQEVNVPVTSPTIVVGGETFSIGGRDLDLVWTPGHTEGHLCVFDRRTGVLFTGDHLLARITPHVGRVHAAGRNPLHDFENSLALVERMAPRRALPAHEGPVEDVGARCREIAAHHQSRRQQILAEVRAQPKTAPQIAKDVFHGRKGGMHQMLALSETEAHLEALVDEGLLVRVQDDEAAEPSYELQA